MTLHLIYIDYTNHIKYAEVKVKSESPNRLVLHSNPVYLKYLPVRCINEIRSTKVNPYIFADDLQAGITKFQEFINEQIGMLNQQTRNWQLLHYEVSSIR